MKKLTEKLHLAIISDIWLNEFANAFYDENYKKMSKMLGKKIKSQYQAEIEMERFKKKLRKVI